MNVLFLTLTDFKDINERGIYYDLIRKIVNEGHRVHVISPIERRFKKNTTITQSDKLVILRVKTLNIQKSSIIEKGLGTLLIEHQFKSAIKRFFADTKFALVIYSTPPITFSKVVEFVKKRDNAKTYLLLKDIFPQNAVDLGYFSKSSILYKFFRKKEKKLYSISDRIGCMSPFNCKYLQIHNSELDSRKIHVNPNSIEIVEKVNISESQKQEIRVKYSIPNDATVYIYGGNIGRPQGISFLIKLLNEFINNSKVFFLIIGSGTEYGQIEKWYKTYFPNNVILLKYLPKNEFDTLTSISDVGLIFLDPRFTIPNFPSRLLSYLDYSLPVLAATDKNTDIGLIIENNNFGLWCENGNLEEMIKHINYFVLNPEKRISMGNNGNQFLRLNYSVEISYKNIFYETPM